MFNWFCLKKFRFVCFFLYYLISFVFALKDISLYDFGPYESFSFSFFFSKTIVFVCFLVSLRDKLVD
jgi:hypothetical protein